MSILKSFALWAVRIVVLLIVFAICFMAGSLPLAGYLPSTPAEPGPLPAGLDLLVVLVAHVAIIALVILQSGWGGWKLMLATAIAYYGLVTFMMQIETAYFLTAITVAPEALIWLFLQTVPVVLLFIPLAVWLLGKHRTPAPDSALATRLKMPWQQWGIKLAVLVLAYVSLYFLAGYFIAWKQPAVRAFYGGVDPGSFWLQLAGVAQDDPWLYPFQILRGLLWVAFALPLIAMTRGRPWQVALVVGLMMSVPQNIGHILSNPLIPVNAVRLAHMVETASSTFVFGFLVGWLLYRRHASLRDLLNDFLPDGGAFQPPAGHTTAA